jgi:hypothetical protein
MMSPTLPPTVYTAALLSLTGRLNQTPRFPSPDTRKGVFKPRDGQWVPRAHRQRRFFHTRWEDQAELPEVPELIDGFMAGGMLHMVYAPSGLGKTAMALQLANAVANGTDFYGRCARRGNVLYLDNEMGARSLRRYGKRLGLRGNIRAEHNVPFAEVIPMIRAAVEDGASLVILDSYASLANQSGNENAVNSNAVAEQVLQPLARLAQDLGVAILVLHHTNKGGIQYDGSQRIKGLVDGFYRLSLDRKAKVMRLWEEKGRFESEPLEWDARDHPQFKDRGTSDDEDEDGNERLEWALGELGAGPKTLDDLKAGFKTLFGLSSKSLERELKDAAQQGLVVKTKAGGKNVFQLPDALSQAA